MEIDAVDNGVNQTEGADLNYKIQTGLANRVSRLNPAWFEEKPDYSRQFQKAMDLCEDELLSSMFSHLKVARPARKLVLDAWEKREEFHSSGEFLWFPRSCPWKGHLFRIEEEKEMVGHTKFVFF